jgi:hypothetical protein
VTLAPATADLLTPLVLRDRLHPELAPFRLERFGWRSGDTGRPAPDAGRPEREPIGV